MTDQIKRSPGGRVEIRGGDAGPDGPGADVLIVGGRGGPAGPGGTVFIRGADGIALPTDAVPRPAGISAGGGSPAAPSDDEAVWILASTLYPEKGLRYKQFQKLLKEHPEIRTRKPSKQRLEVHAGDWLRYWQGKDVAAFERLDGGDHPSVFGDETLVVEGAAERLAALRANKARRKPGK